MTLVFEVADTGTEYHPEEDASAFVSGDGGSGSESPVVVVDPVEPSIVTATIDNPNQPDDAVPPICEDTAEDDDTVESDDGDEIELTPEEKAKVDRQHEKRIAEATEEWKQRALSRSTGEVLLKNMKAEELAAFTLVKSLTNCGPIYPTKKSKIAAAVAGESSLAVDDPNADDSWKQIATASILVGIKGMGAKKVDAIIDLAPTLGDIEELRGQASKAHKHFSEVLPTGVGEVMADEIENRSMAEVGKQYRLSQERSQA